MAGRGKMSGSPFHVETSRYKYAIEHETEHETNVLALHSPVVCGAMNRRTGCCTLWNTGFQRCMHFKCRYFNPEAHRAAECAECAYCYQETCFYPNRPARSPLQDSEARYCCYFFGRNDDPKMFLRIRNCCKRVTLTRTAMECEKTLKSKKRFMARAYQTIQSGTASKADKTYLYSKAREKKQEQKEVKRLLKKCNEELERIGGRLEAFPPPENIGSERAVSNRFPG